MRQAGVSVTGFVIPAVGWGIASLGWRTVLLTTIGAVTGPLGIGMAAESFGSFCKAFAVLIINSISGAVRFDLSRRPR